MASGPTHSDVGLEPGARRRDQTTKLSTKCLKRSGRDFESHRLHHSIDFKPPSRLSERVGVPLWNVDRPTPRSPVSKPSANTSGGAVVASATVITKTESMLVNWEYVGTNHMRLSYIENIIETMDLPYGYAAAARR
jgi:hypothetical protein